MTTKLRIAIVVAVMAALGAARAGMVASSATSAKAAVSPACASPLGASRDPSNPLGLPSPPGANPLNGANFFVPGPAHGAAAGAIAELLGVDPQSLPETYSWQQFKQDLDIGRFHQQL